MNRILHIHIFLEIYGSHIKCGCHVADKTDTMEANLAATFDAGSSFNTKLRDTLQVRLIRMMMMTMMMTIMMIMATIMMVLDSLSEDKEELWPPCNDYIIK